MERKGESDYPFPIDPSIRFRLRPTGFAVTSRSLGMTSMARRPMDIPRVGRVTPKHPSRRYLGRDVVCVLGLAAFPPHFAPGFPRSDIRTPDFPTINGIEPGKTIWRFFGSGIPYDARTAVFKLTGGRQMNETESRTSESANHVLFPMAVGVLFLAVLVAGALLG